MEDYKKKYEEALERAMRLNSGKDVEVKPGTTTCEYIFPELKENDDEKIRKELIKHIKSNCESSFAIFQKFSPEEIIAWLEKQGESQPESFCDPYNGFGFPCYGHRWYFCARDNGIEVWCDAKLQANIPSLQFVPKDTNTHAQKPNGAITFIGYNQGNGNIIVNLEYLTYEQVDEIESLVKSWNAELFSPDKVEPKFKEDALKSLPKWKKVPKTWNLEDNSKVVFSEDFKYYIEKKDLFTVLQRE